MKYLKFTYTNTTDLGNIYFSGGFTPFIYLDAEIENTDSEKFQDGFENGEKEFFPTFQKRVKSYMIRLIASANIRDALEIMEMCDTVSLTLKTNDTMTCKNVKVKSEKLRNCYWDTIVTFDVDELTIKTGCDN